MRAALYEKTGPSSVLRVAEIDAPEPGPGEVRVRVTVSAVNPTDWKSRAGATAAPPDGFQVPHQDGAGVIDAVGAAVRDRAVGERVWIHLAAFRNRFGTAAQYCVVPAARTRPLPDAASDELGASLGVPAVTAAHCLGGDPARLAGQTVMVAGGSGAVGHYAIELAKHAGARVIATTSSEEKAELARRAGADHVVDYRSPRVIDEVRRFAASVDRVVEVALGANLELDLALCHPGTEIVVYANEADDPVLPTRRLMAANARIHWILLYNVRDDELAAALDWTQQALEAGALSTLPIQRFSLDDVAAAQDAVEQHALGKVVVIPE